MIWAGSVIAADRVQERGYKGERAGSPLPRPNGELAQSEEECRRWYSAASALALEAGFA